VNAFKAGVKELAKWIMANFDEFTFYAPPKSYEADTSVIVLSYFEEGAEAPTFIYFMDGLREEKT